MTGEEKRDGVRAEERRLGGGREGKEERPDPTGSPTEHKVECGWVGGDGTEP